MRRFWKAARPLRAIALIQVIYTAFSKVAQEKRRADPKEPHSRVRYLDQNEARRDHAARPATGKRDGFLVVLVGAIKASDVEERVRENGLHFFRWP